MRTERIFDLVVWLFIAAVGLVAAYVCFGILSSEATGQFHQYSVGGAIAGALVSWGVLTSVYLQLRGSSNELQELRNRTEQLQNKVIRGAPRPQGFDTEVDERQRIVLARPKDWQPKGGTIFELEQKMKPDDSFAAAFRCFFVPIESGSTPPREQFYEKELKLLRESSDVVQSYSYELVRLGGESSGVESLKVIVRQFAQISIKPSPETGRIERTWVIVSRDQFTGRISYVEPSGFPVGKPGNVVLVGAWFRKGAVCYVNEKKRQTHVNDQWRANVTLVDEDVAYPGTLELLLENPDTGGLRSSARALLVSEGIEGEEGGGSAPEEKATQQQKTSQSSDATEKRAFPGEGGGGAEEQVVFQEVVRMRVVCYHEPLERIYYLEFFDDMRDFKDSSAVFNRILDSTRFLE